MENDLCFRHEMKYLINKKDMDVTVGRLREFAEPDIHARDGRYFIRSLYYDDIYNTAYDEKESGVEKRCKFRIRSYDHDSSYICLEKKIKQGAFVRKESAVITRDEYDQIRSGQTSFLLKNNEKVANDFALACRMNGLRPAVIVDYDRVPFIYKAGNVRITFDMNVRAVPEEYDIFEKDVRSYEVLGQDILIMEVKYTEFLPDIFRVILPDINCRIAASKYVMSIDTLRRIMTK